MNIKNRSKEIELSDEEFNDVILKLEDFLKLNKKTEQYESYFFYSYFGFCDYKLRLTENQIEKFLDVLFKNSSKCSVYSALSSLKRINFGNNKRKFTKKIIDVFLQIGKEMDFEFEDVVSNLSRILPDLFNNKKIFKILIKEVKETGFYNLDEIDLQCLASILNKSKLPDFDNNFRFFEDELSAARTFFLDDEEYEKSFIFTNFIKERLGI